MKQISLKKYGFERFEEADFSDDGNRFTCYTLYGCTRLRVSKLVSDGQAYLSADITGELYYDEYQSLPHYKMAVWKYNGVSVADLTDEDLTLFASACRDYYNEYLEAEKNATNPTEVEIRSALYKELEFYKQVRIEADGIMEREFFKRVRTAKGDYMYYAKEVLEDYKHVVDAYNDKETRFEERVQFALAHRTNAISIVRRNYTYEEASFWLNYLKKYLKEIK